MTHELQKKIQKSIERLKTFEPEEGYHLAFSGGKDSVVVKALADRAGVKYDAHYHVTTVDPPELVRFIRTQYPDVIFDRPQFSMKQLIVKKLFPPTRLARYCCQYQKEAHGQGRVTVTGTRWAESVRRRDTHGIVTVLSSGAKRLSRQADEIGVEYVVNKRQGMILNMDNDTSRRMVELCYRTHKTLCNPIIDWTDEDVWTFIKEQNLPYCSLYDEGYTRLGCIGCPLGGKRNQKREFERWPQYKKLYLRAFEEMLKKRQELGKETAWETAEDVMNWWLGDTPDKHEVPFTNSGGGNDSNEHESERAYEGDAGQSQATASADPAGGRGADR